MTKNGRVPLLTNGLTTIDKDGNVYTGKAFMVSPMRNMYQTCVTYGQPNSYEMISMNVPCKLYLDVEVDCNWSDLQSTFFVEFFRTSIRNHLSVSFPNIDIAEHSDIMLEACSETKFSIHYVHPEVCFDNSQSSMASYVIEFTEYLKRRIEVAIVGIGDEDKLEVLRQVMDVGCVDLSVYKRNQQFRMIGNTKLGKFIFLVSLMVKVRTGLFVSLRIPYHMNEVSGISDRYVRRWSFSLVAL